MYIPILLFHLLINNQFLNLALEKGRYLIRRVLSVRESFNGKETPLRREKAFLFFHPEVLILQLLSIRNNREESVYTCSELIIVSLER